MYPQSSKQYGEFASYHPAVHLCFFCSAAGITMFCMSPFFLLISLFTSFFYAVKLGGRAVFLKTLFLVIFTVGFVSLLNGFFTHDGDTVLFYINSNRITAEGFLYGMFSGILLSCIILWFQCFGIIMTDDRLAYLFGSLSPVFGLMITMMFRFIPLLKRRFYEIHSAQRSMGKHKGNWISRIKQRMKELSILVAWSLERSIDTADSMAARGYGLKGRTQFHLFRWQKRDITALIWIACSGIVLFIGILKGETTMYYYPSPVWPSFSHQWVYFVCLCALMLVPFWADWQGELRWKQYNLNN